MSGEIAHLLAANGPMSSGALAAALAAHLNITPAAARIRYVGISRNRMADRWRESPALDAETMQSLPKRQLFHSQCWKRIELEVASFPSRTYEVRCIGGHALALELDRLGPPVSGFAALGNDAEGIVAAVERWMCNNSHALLVSWNTAMTRRLA